MLTVWSCSKKTRLTVQFVDYRVTKKVTSPKSTLSAVVTTDALFPPTLIQTESVSVIATDQHFVFSRFKLPREGVILTKVRHIVLFAAAYMAKSADKIWIVDLVSGFDQSKACCTFLRQDFVSSINKLVRGIVASRWFDLSREAIAMLCTQDFGRGGREKYKMSQ